MTACTTCGAAPTAEALEREAEAWRIEDRGFGLASPLVRLALLRGPREAVERLVQATRGWHAAQTLAFLHT